MTHATHLLDEGHREGVPGNNAMVHKLHKGRQCEGEQVTEAKKHKTTATSHVSTTHLH